MIDEDPPFDHDLFLALLDPWPEQKSWEIQFIDRLLTFLLRHRDRFVQRKLCRYSEIPRCSSWVRLTRPSQ